MTLLADWYYEAFIRRHRHSDLIARLEYRRRARELRELAASEGIALPLPVDYIVMLELAGYVVDLQTGEWTPAEELLYTPTLEAQSLRRDGAL